MNVIDLIKKYDGRAVVDSVSFEIPKGKVLSLIGPNGAGKSTVMGMISRLIARDAGAVRFEGRDLAKWKSRELAKKLCILTQHNNIQMKLTVRELVAFGRFPYSGNRLTMEDQEKIDKAIAWMELEDFAEAVKAARAMAKEGDVVILSPACAAFDKFKNFMERGKFFKELVSQF